MKKLLMIIFLSSTLVACGGPCAECMLTGKAPFGATTYGDGAHLEYGMGVY